MENSRTTVLATSCNWRGSFLTGNTLLKNVGYSEWIPRLPLDGNKFNASGAVYMPGSPLSTTSCGASQKEVPPFLRPRRDPLFKRVRRCLRHQSRLKRSHARLGRPCAERAPKAGSTRRPISRLANGNLQEEFRKINPLGRNPLSV